MSTPAPARPAGDREDRPAADSAPSLRGTTALVTGGGRGLGAAISARLAAAGARVAITGRSEQSLRTRAARLENDPVTVTADLAAPDAPAQVLQDALDRLGTVDLLVNNAGIAHFGPSEDLTPAVVDSLLALNVRAPLLLSGLAAAHMAGHGGGSIVNISSGLGLVGSAQGSLYAASKGALDAMTRALAAEWGPRGVRVNAVRAGLVRSEASAWLTEDEALRTGYERTVPLRRLGEPPEIADAVLFLASGQAGFVTGQVLNVDGGTSTTAPSPVAAD